MSVLFFVGMRWLGTLGAAALVLAAACSGDDDSGAPTAAESPGETATATEPVEASPDESPSPGETASATASPEASPPAPTPTGAFTPGGLPEVRLVDAFPNIASLDRPIELVAVPPDDPVLLFVALQEGRVLAWADDPEAPGGSVLEVLDIRAQVSRGGNEEGLLGLAVDPEFSTGRPYIYLHYSVAGGERRGRISRMEAEIGDHAVVIRPETELVILEVPQPFANHNGGKISFGPDGFLYIALGDGGAGGDPQGNGQNPQTLLASILRSDVSQSSSLQAYAIPEGNPFADGEEGRPEVFAYGLRNPWRFSIDSDGRLWAGDVGQGRFEEINLVEPGQNFGWNVAEGFECYNAGSCDTESLTPPVTAYGRSAGDCSVTGGVVYELGDGTGLRGWYVYGDFCSGIIRAFRADDAAASGRAEPEVLIESGLPIASFAQTENGVYVLSFDGRIYRFAAR